MNVEIKKQWAEALRSGKYRQAQLRLRSSSEGYCCLGVLCDLHAKSQGKEWETPTEGPYSYLYLGAPEALPLEVVKWAALSQSNPNVIVGCGHISLAELNDQKGYSFADIAKVIETHL